MRRTQKNSVALLIFRLLVSLFILSMAITSTMAQQQPARKPEPARPVVEGPVKNPTPAVPEQQAPLPQGMAPNRMDDNPYISKTCPELKKALVPLIRKFNELKRREKGLFAEFTQKDKEELSQTKQALDDIKQQLRQRCAEPQKPDPKKKQRR